MMHLLGYMAQQPKISIMALFLGVYALMGLAWGPEWLRESFFPIVLVRVLRAVGMDGGLADLPVAHDRDAGGGVHLREFPGH